MPTKTGKPSEKTRLRRLHERGAYDAASVNAIVDATAQCSVGYVIDGAPYVTPTLHWREGDHIYWHGSSASRMLRQSENAEVCLSISILDGFVMARSGLHHSTNYRSVTMFGMARKIADPDEKEARLKTFVDGLFPGRWNMLRPANAQEIKATTILTMPINEASAKVRAGGPVDDEGDYALPIWAGVIPVQTLCKTPIPDPRNLLGVDMPRHVLNFSLNGP